MKRILITAKLIVAAMLFSLIQTTVLPAKASSPPATATNEFEYWCYAGCGRLQSECVCPVKTPAQTPEITVTIYDALEILKHLAGFRSVYENSGINPAIEDALEILKRLEPVFRQKIK